MVEPNENNRFSRFAKNRIDKQILQKWLDWFTLRGIPAILHYKPNYGWAIYREGLINATKTETDS